MFINRQMRLALLISLLWHLFWMFSVSIVFLPSGFKLKQYFSVHFLGSILSDSLSMAKETDVHRKHSLQFPSEADIQRANHFKASPDVFLATEKVTLSPDSFIDVDIVKDNILTTLSSLTKKTVSVGREVIFRPLLPEYPELEDSQACRAGSVVFKVYISGQGLVQEVINEQASGNPEIDAALARYIRKWRFAPACNLQGQWQSIKINLDDKTRI